jgi:hypothetical protein
MAMKENKEIAKQEASAYQELIQIATKIRFLEPAIQWH